MSSEPIHDEPMFERSTARKYVAMLVIGFAVAQALGVAFKTPTLLEANDISRWCTVWSLLEQGTYAIDDCPWQYRTQDKVLLASKLVPPDAPAKEPGEPEQNGGKGWPVKRKNNRLGRFEYSIAPRTWKADPSKNDEPPAWHFYSSKPPLLPTMIAAVLYPARKISGIPLGREVLTPREPRNVQKPNPDDPSKFVYVLETPKDPIRWPVYVFYFKPIIIALNILPMLICLILYARLLDRVATNDWAWMASLFAGACGTYLFSFAQTLNNHTVAAASAFFALYSLVKIYDEESPSRLSFISAGFWAAFCAANEIPAALFAVLVFLCVLVKSPGRTFAYFVPAAIVPVVAFFVTQYAAMGQFTPVYEDFGTAAYEYKGSLWATPLEMDYFNKVPETKAVYLMHMLVGHHGVFSLSPIVVFAILGSFLAFAGQSRGLKVVSVLSLLLTIAMVVFYMYNPKARNYGGSTQGLRWLFWLVPFWLFTLPPGVAPGGERRVYRWLTLLAIMVSVMSVGYSLRHPWSHPWILDLMEQCGLYSLKR